MCGISGWITHGTPGLCENDLLAMVTAQQHRGPDDSGTFIDAGRGIALGHNRLSIIDLSDQGHQPMQNAQTGDVLVFNGEIYNFADLRQQLNSRGYSFRSSSDTEVLLYSFAEWSIGCLEKIQGMFSFALWSPQTDTLHIVRDPMGIKPLYYWILPGEEGVVFSSEIKAFLQLANFRTEINKRSLQQFLEFGYTWDFSETIFKDVYKLAPGHRMALQNRGKIELHCYYSPVLSPFGNLDSQLLEEKLYTTLSQVIKEQLVADVPVGLLLSGGLDSSIIAAIASQNGAIHTYSMGFADSGVDERPFARLVSEFIGSEHEEILIQPAELMTDLETIVLYFDDLFADWGMISTRLLYQKCRDKGIKVVIVGEGSDELFGGYDIFRHALAVNEKKSMEWRLFQLYRSYSGRRYGRLYLRFRAQMKVYLQLTGGSLFEAIRLFESRSQLPNNYVMKVDKASMSVSVEARVPFLDQRVAEIAYRIPGEMLVDAHGEKRLLRRMAKRYNLLPDEILQRKKFGAGIAASWMDDSLEFRKYARDIILAEDSWVDDLGLRSAMVAYFDRGKQGFIFPFSISIFRNLAWRLLIITLWQKKYPIASGNA
jgi:asparagine synthase (glutamine-hydrolysing)